MEIDEVNLKRREQKSHQVLETQCSGSFSPRRTSLVLHDLAGMVGQSSLSLSRIYQLCDAQFARRLLTHFLEPFLYETLDDEEEGLTSSIIPFKLYPVT